MNDIHQIKRYAQWEVSIPATHPGIPAKKPWTIDSHTISAANHGEHMTFVTGAQQRMCLNWGLEHRPSVRISETVAASAGSTVRLSVSATWPRGYLTSAAFPLLSPLISPYIISGCSFQAKPYMVQACRRESSFCISHLQWQTVPLSVPLRRSPGWFRDGRAPCARATSQLNSLIYWENPSRLSIFEVAIFRRRWRIEYFRKFSEPVV